MAKKKNFMNNRVPMVNRFGTRANPLKENVSDWEKAGYTIVKEEDPISGDENAQKGDSES